MSWPVSNTVTVHFMQYFWTNILGVIVFVFYFPFSVIFLAKFSVSKWKGVGKIRNACTQIHLSVSSPILSVILYRLQDLPSQTFFSDLSYCSISAFSLL